MPKHFAAIYEPGPDWIPGKPINQQPLGDHVTYLKDLHARNVVKMGGPFANGKAGLVILEASDDVEATRFIEDDPAIQAGILSVRVHEWNRLV